MRAYFGSLVLSVLSRWLIQFCLYLSLTSCIPEISSSCLMSWLLILSSLVYPVTLLRKRISAASRPVISLSVVIQVSLPYSSDGPATTFIKCHLCFCTVFLQCFLMVPYVPSNLFIFLSKSGSPSKLVALK